MDGWANPDGGDRPIVQFTTPQGALVTFMGGPDMGRFGANIGDAVAVRYNASRLEGLGVRPGGQPLTSERLPMSVARSATLRGSWTGPGTLMLFGAALMYPGLSVLAGA